MSRFFLTAVLLAAPAAAYVAPGVPGSDLSRTLNSRHAMNDPVLGEVEEQVVESGTMGAVAAGFGVGALLGWLKMRKQQVASLATATALAVSPAAANAYVDYEGLQYLGGSDKVDINNANVQAYRQFPGMYPTAAGMICTHGPYKSVQEVYDIPGMDDKIKGIIKKYEGNLVSLPANPAYFIDRINNGLYR
eukprot:TRINITY_DN2495_c1_g1_i2.p1 TRINITY_DN2495_c1_g1~~TRINITY_DN2495_c1_g1_i2.p1  ORF type:complete len:191 (-),score=38.76 TRINITY_DN2495_c1_g1_i2:53-625(-)